MKTRIRRRIKEMTRKSSSAIKSEWINYVFAKENAFVFLLLFRQFFGVDYLHRAHPNVKNPLDVLMRKVIKTERVLLIIIIARIIHKSLKSILLHRKNCFNVLNMRAKKENQWLVSFWIMSHSNTLNEITFDDKFELSMREGKIYEAKVRWWTKSI
jgi:hypothetical protein